MTRYSTCLRTLLTLLLVLTGVSASEAGLFGRWRARYDYYTPCPAAATLTPAAASVSATGQPAAGPIVYTAAKPVIGENAAAATVPVPRNQTYVPVASGNSGTGWSTLPRSTWDFGKYPPYSN